MLEVVGVTGIVHMGQIQSGLSRALRIAQGGRIKLRLNTEVPIQVDGEPWIQSACEVNIIRSALKATMLRKSKMKRRNTEPSINRDQPAGGQSGTGPANEKDPSEKDYTSSRQIKVNNL